MSEVPVILMKSLVGSRLYNLETEDSDYDYRYVQVSPLAHALSPFRNLDTKTKVEGKEDDAIWEFRMFTKYAANGNPSIYEALYSDQIEWFPGSDSSDQRTCAMYLIGTEMVHNREKFLDARKVYDAHRGYATAQMKKLNWEQPDMRHRKALVAYLRILRQGTDLLRTGTFLPRLEGGFQEFLMTVKEAYEPAMRPFIEHKMQKGEEEIAAAFESTILREANYPYVEDLIRRMYLARG